MPKYVFSSTLTTTEWDNCTITGPDVVAATARLKKATRGDLLIWGHTRLAETLMRHGLVDVLELSIHPLLVGHGGLLLREGLEMPLRLVSAKAFSQIVKLTYQLQPRPWNRRISRAREETGLILRTSGVSGLSIVGRRDK